MKKEKIVIGLDIDGVLRDFNIGLYNALCEAYPDFKDRFYKEPKRYDYFHDFPFKEILQKEFGIKNPSVKQIKEFPIEFFDKHHSEQVFLQAPIYPWAKEGIKKIKNILEYFPDVELKICTRQQNLAKYYTMMWLGKHKIDINQIVIVQDTIDKWNYVDILIDDCPTFFKNIPEDKIPIRFEHLYNNEYKTKYSTNKFENIEQTLFDAIVDYQSNIL